MVAITNFLILAGVAAANVLPRDYSTLNTDLQKINTDTVQLTKDTNAYNGGGAANAVPIQNDYNAVDKDVNQANTDAKNSAALSASDAQKLIDYINKTLEPNVAGAITALTNKKSKFATDGVQSTVCSDLKTLKTDVDTLGASLLAKVPSGTTKTNGQSALNKIDADLNKGITAFC